MARGDKPGHERGKVSGGSGKGRDTDPTKDKAATHVHNFNITRPDGKKACTCGEVQ